MRLINFVSLGVLLGLVFLIYELKYETRRLEIRAATLAKEIAEEKEHLGLMRAEWSYKSRPEVVEQMAGELLGLQPVKPEQIIPFDDVASNEGGRRAPGKPYSFETTGAIPRRGAGVKGRRDEIGALINSLTRRTDDDRAAR
jgi:cell division protein FtsL